MPTLRLKCLLLAAGALLAPPLAAQEPVVIYRCTAADGSLIVQNDRPCPRGTTQQDRRVIQPAPTAPSPPRAITAPDPPLPVPPGGSALIETAPNPAGSLAVPPQGPMLPASAPTTLPVAPVDVDVLATPVDARPPPALFECRTPDGAVYLGEDPTPPPRCALPTAAGAAAVPPAAGACQLVTDRCAPVPAALLCERWRQRLREMQAALTFGRLDERETATVEIDRIRSVVEDSTCAGSP